MNKCRDATLSGICFRLAESLSGARVVLRCAMLVSPHWPTAIQEAVMVVALTTRLSFKQVFYGETDSW